MKRLSEEKIIEIINNNEEFIFKKFKLDDEFDYYIGEELYDNFVGIGYDNGERGVAFMNVDDELDWGITEEAGVLELDGFKIRFEEFVN